MIKSKNSLVLIKIKKGSSETKRVLHSKDKLTIGKNPDNDIVVYDAKVPKSHTLLEYKKGRFHLNVLPELNGNLYYKESVLSFQDLLIQDILPQNGKHACLKLKDGQAGRIKLQDTLLDFKFSTSMDGAAEKPKANYSWTSATNQSLKRDLLFKVLLTLFILFEVGFGVWIGKIELAPEKPPDIAKVPERFAKFVIKKQEPKQEVQITSTNGTAEGTEQDENKTEEKEGSKKKKTSGGSSDQSKKPVASQGLLGLIGGRGESSVSSSAVDFLIDKGLVQELDNLLGKKSLHKNKNGVGRGNGTGSGVGSGSGDGIDDLLDFGLSGGIDDLIGDEGVEKVNLSKKGKVNIQTPGRVRGSQAAMGQRTADAVMAVINSQQGRIMYQYNKYLRKDPNLGGKISLDVTIEANGRVSKVDVVESSISNQDFIREVLNILRRLKFPPIQEGSVTVNVPFVFNRVN